MALIQKIRSKSGLVLALMILAIVAFIGMLITQDSNRSWQNLGNSTTVVKAAGKALDYTELRSDIDAMGGRGDASVMGQMVDMFIDGAIIEKEASALGISVPKEELQALMFGDAAKQIMPSQVVLRNPAFADPKSGRVTMEQLENIKNMVSTNQLTPQGLALIAQTEKQVISDRLQGKLRSLVTNAFFTPDWLVEQEYKALTQPVNFEYVRVPFDRVEDKDAPVTDADYKAFINENPARFTTEEERRTIEYAVIDIAASGSDSAKVYKKLADLRDTFRNTTKDSFFVIAKGGAWGEYQKAEAIAAAAKDSFVNAPVGTVYGPFVNGKTYDLVKVVGRKSFPDSVQSRHILLKPSQERSLAAAQALGDSLAKMLTAGTAKWDSLNAQYSDDQVAKTSGGDLGYQSYDVNFDPIFKEAIFNAPQGKYTVITSSFGVHIIQVTGVKAGKNEGRVRLATISELILPSNETMRAITRTANELLTSSGNTLEGLKKAATAKNIAVLPASPFRASDNTIGQLGTSTRDIIRWAFDAKKGQLADQVFTVTNQGESAPSKFVIAGLKNVQPKGLQSVEDVKEMITPSVKNRKKGEVIASKIQTGDLNAIAGQFNATIDTATGVTFNANMVPKLGSESKVMGAAFTTAVGASSKAIVGDGGVFVLKVTNKETITNSPVDKEQLRKQTTDQMRQANGGFIRGLRKSANIDDNRVKFF